MPTRTRFRALGRVTQARRSGRGAARIGLRPGERSLLLLAVLLLVPLLSCGCTSLREYVHNGFKVGPNYGRPPAAVANDWIDASDERVRKESDDLSKWWTVFKDPTLDSLICFAYQQNLTLREAGFRVLEARAQFLIDVGNLFPQTQAMTGSYTRNVFSLAVANAQIGNTPVGTTQVARTRKRWYGQW